MSFDTQTLYDLLPAVIRIRDDEQGQPLRALMEVLASQVAVLEEDLEQLYDDQFIETCADWVVPYIGDVIGYRLLHGVVPEISSPRAEVANTIAFRRRKGTAAMLEQLSRDVTGWPARVVEFFQLLSTTQYMNHLRPAALATPDLRDWEKLEYLGTPFEKAAHTVEVRRIATGSGRYNIPNIGVSLWRLGAYRLEESPALPAAADQQRFMISPLGNNAPLFSRPEREARITHLAEPRNVPMEISRRILDAHFDNYYGAELSLQIRENGAVLPEAAICVCDLRDTGGGDWAGRPATGVAIDPVLGRLYFADPPGPGGRAVSVTFHYGFSADIGGGSYDRAASMAELRPGQQRVRVPDDQLTIAAALAALPPDGGIVEITDNGRYEGALQIAAPAGASIELRAANGRRPILVLPDALQITGGDGASVSLNGLVIAAANPASGDSGVVTVPPTTENVLAALAIRHCTLVPGRALNLDGTAQLPGAESLVVGRGGVTVTIESTILGALRINPASTVTAANSIIDAGQLTAIAYGGIISGDAGGSFSCTSCTVMGQIHAAVLPVVSNSILLAESTGSGNQFVPPLRAVRRQEGCLRFSFVPLGSIVPRRHRCQPDTEIARRIEEIQQSTGTTLDQAKRDQIRDAVMRSLRPSFTSRRFGDPGYGQLRLSSPVQIHKGTDDESEMGAFHDLFQPQRETNLHVRLDEYLRFNLEAGVSYET